MNYLVGFELYKNFHNYYPIVFSISYQHRGKVYAFIIYGHFNKDGNNKINGVHVTKQLVIVSKVLSKYYISICLLILVTKTELSIDQWNTF